MNHQNNISWKKVVIWILRILPGEKCIFPFFKVHSAFCEQAHKVKLEDSVV